MDTVGLYSNKWAVSNPVCRRQNAWSVDRRRCRRSQAITVSLAFDIVKRMRYDALPLSSPLANDKLSS